MHTGADCMVSSVHTIHDGCRLHMVHAQCKGAEHCDVNEALHKEAGLCRPSAPMTTAKEE